MIRKKKLPNGLTLLMETMPDVRSVTLGVWLRLGSRDEAGRLNGISHFVEHLVFKGTETRNAREIALEMDSIGGQIDAFTSKEYTCFYAKVLDDHLAVAVDLLADIVQRPAFDQTEVERERQVVIEEIQMVDDTPDELIYDLFSAHAYPRHALGRPIQGTAETVGSFDRRQLLKFFRGSYRPENMLLVAAGNFDPAEMSRLARDAFSGLAPGCAANGRGPVPRARPGIISRSRRELSQLHLLLGLPASPQQFAERYQLYVLNALFGGTMSSRLFQKIREERGLVYSVYSGIHAYVDAGFLNIYAATRPKTAAEVVRLVLDEIRDLSKNGPTEDELRVAKEHLKGSLMLGLESTSARMSNLARQEIYYGRRFGLEQTLRGIERVTARQVHSLVERLAHRRRLSLAVVGRVDRLRLDAQDLRL